MFTGIVKAVGKLARADLKETGGLLCIDSGSLDLSAVQLGDSISVSGVCLTVIALHDQGFDADVSRETLECTTLGQLPVGGQVNLEPALTLAQPLGGHLVTGHVDGVGTVSSVENDGDTVKLKLRVPDELARYVAAKGSLCVDGTSLTVNAVDGASAEITIVPHTLEETVIVNYIRDTKVNIEVDLIARYLERIVQYTA
jgi:riboflavin synthase